MVRANTWGVRPVPLSDGLERPPGLQVWEHCVEFRQPRDSLSVLLAQISPAHDPGLLESCGLIRCRDPDKQAHKVITIIEYAVQHDINLVLFPELTVPFAHLPRFEEAVHRIEGELVVNLCYEHTPLRDLVPVLSPEEREQLGLARAADDPRMANFCRILVKTRNALHVFTQLKLTPYSGEFSLSAQETLFCGHVLHKFVTNWGSFLFLICKDYVGEVGRARRVPMFDFLKDLTEGGLHYIFVSAMNPEPGAFVHAARAFYYLQEKCGHTFTVLLNTAELGHTAIIFPARPHPRIRPAADIELVPLFEGKSGWGTYLKFTRRGERLIAGTMMRLDKYTPLPTKEIFSPVYRIQQLDIADLGIAPDVIVRPEAPPPEKAPAPPGNLPTPATPFVGRERELAEMERLLADPACRLITLVGPGGMGKTRLAVEAAARRRNAFAHGAFFVPLAALGSVEQLVPTIADSIGVPSYSGENPKAQLLDYLREKEMLIVLDNFEHLVEGAGLVGEMLAAAPGVKLIVTSRERLNLHGEWLIEVAGLDEGSAVELFLQSARRVCPGFSPSAGETAEIARICALVGRMPLAIELAASWLRVLPLEEIAGEIRANIDFLTASFRDIPERHRSLRAVFDHSWGLLSEEERRALRRLSVFHGGFERKAAAEVAGVSLPLLAALVDKSLLTRGQKGRYGLHELLRSYALRKLHAEGDEEREVLKRHCTYYAGFAATRAECLGGADQEEALEELRTEHGNIRAAWEFALGEFDEGALAGLIDGLHRFYEIRGRFQEGKEAFAGAIGPLRARGTGGPILAKVLVRAGRFLHALGASREAKPLIEEGLARARELGDAREIAFALTALGELMSFFGEHSQAEGLLREALGRYREVGYRPGIAAALNALGTVAWRQGRYEDAKALYQEGLALERGLGDRRGMALSLNNLGIIYGLLGELEEARKLFTEGLTISEELGDLPSMSRCLNNLGIAAMKLGDLEQARAFHERGLAIERETGNRAGIAGSLSNLGNLAYRMGEYGEAKRLYLDSLRVRRETGDSLGEIISLMNLCEVCFAVGEEEEGVSYLREGLGRALEVRADPLVLGCVAKLAGHLMRRGEVGRAAELVGLVLHHPALEIDAKGEVDGLLPKLRDAMSPEELERALERGRGLDLEEVARGFLSG